MCPNHLRSWLVSSTCSHEKDDDCRCHGKVNHESDKQHNLTSRLNLRFASRLFIRLAFAHPL
jgi:hypothetical protein